MSAPTSEPGYQPALLEQRHRQSFPTARAIMALVLREMASTYGRSPLGYLWAILMPAAGVAVLAVCFSLLMRSPPLGTNFTIFFATGMVPYRMWRGLVGKVAGAMQYSRQLLVYPRVTFLDAILARFLLNALTDLLVFYIVIAGIMLAFETRVAPDLPKIALGLVMLMALAFSVGVFNCFLNWVLPFWERLWNITTRPLFFISGVLFLVEDLPDPYSKWLMWNPLVHGIGQLRKGFYPYYDAPYIDVMYVFTISLVAGVLGLLFLRRFNLDILDR
ncbi:MAG: ABC transporter permease [Rhodobacter sp.]|nr:ABC transporter permease [Rhodobacter sp.]